MRILINGYELCSGVGVDQVIDFNLDGARAMQMGRYLRAGAVKAFDRGNAELAIQLTVSREHASEQAAAFFLFSHLKDIPPAGEVTFETTGETGAILSATIASSVVRGFGSRWSGVTTWHRYTIAGGGLYFGTSRSIQRIDGGGLLPTVQ